MNKRVIYFAVFLLMPLALPVFAVETAVVPAVRLAQPSKPSASMIPFSTRVTPEGQLISKPGEVFTKGGHYEGMKLPYLLGNPAPIRYPRWAVRQGWEGAFVIAIEVRKDGSVGRYKVMKSTGHKRLDEAAIAGIKEWKFHPAVKNGKIVVTCVELPVMFQLQE